MLPSSFLLLCFLQAHLGKTLIKQCESNADWLDLYTSTSVGHGFAIYDYACLIYDYVLRPFT